MKKIFILFIALSLFVSYGFSQNDLQVISTAGETFSNDDIIVSWTLGEPIISTFENDDIILTQGFEQGTYSVTAIKTLPTENFDIEIFPNPTSEEFFVKCKNLDAKNIDVKLFDLSGNLVYANTFNSQVLKINVTSLKAAEYILNIYYNQSNTHSYKVIKF